MPCYSLLKGYRAKTVNESGKRSIVFSPRDGFNDLPIDIPCGQCIGCKLEKSRQWAIRIMHETQLHPKSVFITLTYSPENQPENGSLDKRDFQLFMKRLRKRFTQKIRFYHCGEYGESTSRPHYHAIIFNLDFQDKQLISEARGNKIYISQTLSELWPLGHSSIGSVTFESAAYVARYVTKKQTGKQAEYYYSVVDQDSGEIKGQIQKEYSTMSRRPGIAKNWLNKFTSDVYPDDFVVMRGKKLKPPKFYDKQFEHQYPEQFALIKGARKKQSKEEKTKLNNTHERILVREKIQKIKLKQLKRNYENDT